MDPTGGLDALFGSLGGFAAIFSQIVTAAIEFAGVFMTSVLPVLVSLFYSTLGPLGTI